MISAPTARVLVVDDQDANVRVLRDQLLRRGYEVVTASSGQAALHVLDQETIDIVLLDVVMPPGPSGIEVCRTIKGDVRRKMLPVVLVTAGSDDGDRLRGLEAGADDFLTKPIDVAELFARVRTLLHASALFRTTEAQAEQLRRLNEELEQRVRVKVAENERLVRLKRFLAPQVAERLLGDDGDSPLQSHRRDISVVFFDLRGFTAFAESNAPEDVMRALHEFHCVVGAEAHRHRGTIERFVGDGVMVFFNDPEPIEDPIGAAVEFACDVFGGAEPLVASWGRSAFGLDIGCGIAYGYATLGPVGYAERTDYGAIGTVTNLAARLCAEAKGGQILASGRVASSLKPPFSCESVGVHALKGFREPVPAFSVSRGAIARTGT